MGKSHVQEEFFPEAVSWESRGDMGRAECQAEEATYWQAGRSPGTERPCCLDCRERGESGQDETEEVGGADCADLVGHDKDLFLTLKATGRHQSVPAL